MLDNSSFTFTDYQLQCFRNKLKNMTYMYGEGNLEYIELDFDYSIYSNMIDKFGKDIKPHKINDRVYRVQVKNTINSTFYSWVIGFGGKIQISGNEEQIKKFKDFLNNQFIK